MIIRKRRKTEPLPGQANGFVTHRLDAPEFLSQPQFRREVLKEIGRSNRRSVDREFGLIRVTFDRGESDVQQLESAVIEAFQNRLRISDSVGWYDDALAFLLPETDQDGTLTVANSLSEIAVEAGINVETEVSIYPWDDDLVVMSDEFKMMAADQVRNTDNSDDQDRPDGQNGNQQPMSGSAGKSPEASSTKPGNPIQFQRMTEHVFHNRHSFVPLRPTPWWKRTIDVAAAGTGLLVLSPVFLVAAVAIKTSSSGPVFFRQMREGKNGRPFGILKFRTMVVDAEQKQDELRSQNEQDGPAFKLAADPRITSVGKYLRKSCVDELPQLVNVLVGQMSLVGPRPLPMHESFACQAWQRTRLTVLPGLTCTWQVRGGRDVTFAQWMRMDLDYIQHRSLWFDLKLILETALIAILHRGSV